MKNLVYLALVASCLYGCSSSKNTPSTSSTVSSSSSSSSSSSTGYTYKWGTNNKLYADDALMKVEITMTEEDWGQMRYDGPQISDWSPACTFEGYPYYTSSVLINNEPVSDVDIRKKGWIGSVTSLRPSVKLNFSRNEEFQDRTFYGHKRITLNNNRQDPSNIKQCLSYSLFNQAGIHAPRCGFAHVSIQGKDLGIYTHVESIKKPFLLRTFGNNDGNLYEIQRDGEFDEAHIDFFQLKTNEKENDRSDLVAVLNAMNAPEDDLWQALNEVIDLQQFARFTAMEALLGHTDGYTGFQNNTYLYHNESDNRFHFIPWGTDQTFVRDHVYPGGIVPASIMLGSKLIQRLWLNNSFQSEYQQQLRTLLDTVWNETEINAEITRMASLLGTPQYLTQTISNFVNERRQLVESELTGGSSTEWTWNLLSDIESCPLTTPISGDFNITFGSNPASTSDSFSVLYDGVEFQALDGYSVVELNNDRYRLTIIAISNTQQSIQVGFSIPSALWNKGSVPLHSLETTGYAQLTTQDGERVFLGSLSDGEIKFDTIGTSEGSSISGTFSAVAVNP